MSVGYLEVGADRFPVAIQGEGVPILFVHGAPGDWRTFAPHAALLSDRYRCITYTQRWFGTAQWRADGPAFGTQAHADDLIALAEALAIPQLNLIAWSYGAHPAFHAAIERPDLFASLLVYEPGFATFVDDFYLKKQYSQDSEAAWGPVFAARSSDEPDAMLRAMWDASGGAGSFDSLPEEQKNMLRDSAPALPMLLDQTPPIPITWTQLDRLQIPTAVAWGQQSRACYLIPSQAAAECIGGNRFEIAQVGHLWPHTHPEGFAKVVDHWLGPLRELGPA
jgi:pimeloyl-ACP methyl ester carboxylesterase